MIDFCRYFLFTLKGLHVLRATKTHQEPVFLMCEVFFKVLDPGKVPLYIAPFAIAVVVVVVVVVVGQTVGPISSKTLAYYYLYTLELCTASMIATS